MPVYEYRCNACGRESEVQQRMSDPELVHCDACGADKLERLISRTAFQLKGSGWYKDLYASSKPEAKADAKPDAPAAKPDAGSGAAASASGSGESSSSAGSSSSGSGGGSSTGSSGGGTSSTSAS